MADTLTYGLVVPRNPDTGATFWEDLEKDLEALDAHTHNGVNSPLLAKTQSISSASWGTIAADGSYTQTITLASGLLFDSIAIQFRLSTGAAIYPTYAKASSTTYTITVNNNTLNITAIYT